MISTNKKAMIHALTEHVGVCSSLIADFSNQLKAEETLSAGDALTPEESAALKLLADRAVARQSIQAYVSTEAENRAVFTATDTLPDQSNL